MQTVERLLLLIIIVTFLTAEAQQGPTAECGLLEVVDEAGTPFTFDFRGLHKSPYAAWRFPASAQLDSYFFNFCEELHYDPPCEESAVCYVDQRFTPFLMINYGLLNSTTVTTLQMTDFGGKPVSPLDGFTVTYNDGDPSTTTGQPHVTTIHVVCDVSSKNFFYTLPSDNPEIAMTSEFACKFRPQVGKGMIAVDTESSAIWRLELNYNYSDYEVTTLATGIKSPSVVTTDGIDLFWVTEPATNFIWTAPIANVSDGIHVIPTASWLGRGQSIDGLCASHGLVAVIWGGGAHMTVLRADGTVVVADVTDTMLDGQCSFNKKGTGIWFIHADATTKATCLASFDLETRQISLFNPLSITQLDSRDDTIVVLQDNKNVIWQTEDSVVPVAKPPTLPTRKFDITQRGFSAVLDLTFDSHGITYLQIENDQTVVILPGNDFIVVPNLPLYATSTTGI